MGPTCQVHLVLFSNCMAWYLFGLVQRKQSPYLPSWKALTWKWSNNPEEQCLSHLFALGVITVQAPCQARTREHLEAEKKTGRTMWISWGKKTGRTKLYNHGVMFRHSNQICNSLKLHPLLLIISCSIVNCTWRLGQFCIGQCFNHVPSL